MQSDSVSEPVDTEASYRALNSSYERREQIAANANHSLSIVRGLWTVTPLFVDKIARQLAASNYARQSLRTPLPIIAAINGAFSPATHALILADNAKTEDRALTCDIRFGLKLMERGVPLVAKKPVAEAEQFLAELAVVSALCAGMNGFARNVEIRRTFDAAKVDFTAFDRAYATQPAFRAAVTQYMKNAQD